MRLFFARHGETDWNAKKWIQGSTDIELNDQGLKQAAVLADALKGKNIACIYTSRLRRAADTAGIVAKELKIPCIVKEGLEEICMGDWEGRTWYDVKCGWEEFYEYWKSHRRIACPPNGESYDDLIRRLIAAVKDIISERKGDVLVLTHSACIQILLAEIHGTPIETMSKDYPIPNAEVIEIDPDSILNL